MRYCALLFVSLTLYSFVTLGSSVPIVGAPIVDRPRQVTAAPSSEGVGRNMVHPHWRYYGVYYKSPPSDGFYGYNPGKWTKTDWDHDSRIVYPDEIKQNSFGRSQKNYPKKWCQHHHNFEYDDMDSSASEIDQIYLKPRPVRAIDQQDLFRCMKSCYVYSQYDPVCGSDNETYSNEQNLKCAAECGREVTVFSRGACLSPLEEPE